MAHFISTTITTTLIPYISDNAIMPYVTSTVVPFLGTLAATAVTVGSTITPILFTLASQALPYFGPITALIVVIKLEPLITGLGNLANASGNLTNAAAFSVTSLTYTAIAVAVLFTGKILRVPYFNLAILACIGIAFQFFISISNDAEGKCACANRVFNFFNCEISSSCENARYRDEITQFITDLHSLFSLGLFAILNIDNVLRNRCEFIRTYVPNPEAIATRVSNYIGPLALRN